MTQRQIEEMRKKQPDATTKELQTKQLVIETLHLGGKKAAPKMRTYQKKTSSRSSGSASSERLIKKKDGPLSFEELETIITPIDVPSRQSREIVSIREPPAKLFDIKYAPIVVSEATRHLLDKQAIKLLEILEAEKQIGYPIFLEELPGIMKPVKESTTILYIPDRIPRLPTNLNSDFQKKKSVEGSNTASDDLTEEELVLLCEEIDASCQKAEEEARQREMEERQKRKEKGECQEEEQSSSAQGCTSVFVSHMISTPASSGVPRRIKNVEALRLKVGTISGPYQPWHIAGYNIHRDVFLYFLLKVFPLPHAHLAFNLIPDIFSHRFQQRKLSFSGIQNYERISITEYFYHIIYSGNIFSEAITASEFIFDEEVSENISIPVSASEAPPAQDELSHESMASVHTEKLSLDEDISSAGQTVAHTATCNTEPSVPIQADHLSVVHQRLDNLEASINYLRTDLTELDLSVNDRIDSMHSDLKSMLHQILEKLN